MIERKTVRRFDRSFDLTQSYKLEVLCGCDDSYLPHAATMICSLLEHNSGCRIHLFCNSVTNGELAKLKSLVARYGSELVSYQVASEEFKDLRVDKWKPHSSIANYFRVLAPQLLPTNITKILYLDCDIIVRRSLKNLWNVDLCDHALAAVECSFWDSTSDYFVPLPVGAKYFNSGVLLVNLDYWRENDVCERTLAFVRNNPEKVNLYDQDALNAVLANRWVTLPATWNEQARSTIGRPALRDEHILDPAIVHFVSADKPWHWRCIHPLKAEYHKYRRRTPWRHNRIQDKPRMTQRLGRQLLSLIRVILPRNLRQWLRSLVTASRA
jgi:lipopolysaccharide biosynthesis glycosyltransferase